MNRLTARQSSPKLEHRPTRWLSTIDRLWGTLSLLMIVTCWPGSVSADVIWVRGQASPTYGRIESWGPENLSFRTFKDGQLGPPTSLSRNSIEQFVVNVDQTRLSKLASSQPAKYRDYAEELASQATDPVARRLARRLFLIAAAQPEPNLMTAEQQSELQASALAGLYKFADSKAERKQIQRLWYLLSPTGSEVMFARPTEPTARLSTEQRNQLIELVQAIRQEKQAQTLVLLATLQTEKLRSALEPFGELCSAEELEQIAGVNRPNKSQLSKLLQLEIALLENLEEGSESTRANSLKRPKDWGDFATAPTSNLEASPSFENLTPFDPKRSIFRNGDWIRPTQDVP